MMMMIGNDGAGGGDGANAADIELAQCLFDGNGGSAGNAAVMVMEGDDGGDDKGLINLVLVQLAHTPKQYDLHSELIDSS